MHDACTQMGPEENWMQNFVLCSDNSKTLGQAIEERDGHAIEERVERTFESLANQVKPICLTLCNKSSYTCMFVGTQAASSDAILKWAAAIQNEANAKNALVGAINAAISVKIAHTAASQVSNAAAIALATAAEDMRIKNEELNLAWLSDQSAASVTADFQPTHYPV